MTEVKDLVRTDLQEVTKLLVMARETIGEEVLIGGIQIIEKKLVGDSPIRTPDDVIGELSLPKDYPLLEKFHSSMLNVAQEEETQRPDVGVQVSLAEVALYAQTDFRSLRGRFNTSIVIYAYVLGLIMSSKPHYLKLERIDYPITVGENWQIENGRHRAFALRALGSEYVQSSGIDHWIKVTRV